MRDAPLLFVDLETSGLDPTKHEILEVAALLCSPDGRELWWSHEARMMPQGPVEPAAAALNGYSEDVWARTCLPRRAALQPIADLSVSRGKAMLVTHNTPFDKAFLERGLAAVGLEWQGDYHSVDTAALAWPLVRAGLVEKVRLGALCEFFGVVNERPHSAMGDVKACRAVYLKMMDGYSKAFGGNR